MTHGELEQRVEKLEDLLILLLTATVWAATPSSLRADHKRRMFFKILGIDEAEFKRLTKIADERLR